MSVKTRANTETHQMVGTTVSHYQILENIGTGGMGVVYKALDSRLDRLVALKFLPQQFSIKEGDKKRLVHEAKAAAALDHKNICSIFEIDETNDGQMFIVMAYYKGQTLYQKLALRPLPLSKVLDHAIQITEGLSQAHKKGIIHRDIKTTNIIITEEGVVKIVDFGLAKLKGLTKLTRKGATLGTAAYMSPEQVSGKEVDHRSDIWSLGVAMYEMITGQLPFKGESDQSVMYSIINEEAEPITGLRTGVSPELERIVIKALSKNPQYRYQHMDDMLADLKCLHHQSDKEKEPGTSPVRTKKKKTFFLLTTAIVLMGVALTIFLKNFLFKPETQTETFRKVLVVLPFENLGHAEDEYFTTGMTEEITTRLAMIRNLGVISRSSANKYANTSKTIKQIGQELGVHYVLKGTVRWGKAPSGPEMVRICPHLIRVSDDTHVWADIFDRVIEDIFQVQTDIARKVTEELNITLKDPERTAVEAPSTNNVEAYQAFLQGRYLAQHPHFSLKKWFKVIQYYQRAVELDPQFALAFAELAKAHARLVFFNHDLTRERKEMARKAAERAMALNPQSPKVHLALSYYHLWIARDYQRALKELEIAEKGLPNSTGVMKAKASIYESLGRFQDVIELIKRAYELSPLDSSLPSKLTGIHWVTRKYQTALEYCRQTGTLAPQTAWPHIFEMLIHWSWKTNFKKAREALEKVPPNHTWIPYCWLWQEIGEGKYQQAIERLEANPNDWIAVKVTAIPKTLAFAYLYEFLDQPDKARHYYEQSKTILAREIEKTPDDPRLHSSLGLTLASLGFKKEAIKEGKLATQLLPISKDALYGALYISDLGLIYTIVGEYKSALDQVEYLLSIPSWHSPGWMKLDPRWNKLKNLPRFQRILQDYYRRVPD